MNSEIKKFKMYTFTSEIHQMAFDLTYGLTSGLAMQQSMIVENYILAH